MLKEVRMKISSQAVDLSWFNPGGGWSSNNNVEEWQKQEAVFEYPNSPSNESIQPEEESLSQEQGDQRPPDTDFLKEFESYKVGFEPSRNPMAVFESLIESGSLPCLDFRLKKLAVQSLFWVSLLEIEQHLIAKLNGNSRHSVLMKGHELKCDQSHCHFKVSIISDKVGDFVVYRLASGSELTHSD